MKNNSSAIRSQKLNDILCSLSASKLSSTTSNELEGITIDANHSRSENTNAKHLIDNYNVILQYIKENNHTIKLTNNEILGWHKMLFTNTNQQDRIGGKFKTTNNQIIDQNNQVLIEGVEPWKTPSSLEQINAWYVNDNSLPDIIKAIIYNFDFLSIHPFNDGNGRISRLLLNYMLIGCGHDVLKIISLEQIILKHKNKYLQSLRACNSLWNEHNNTYEPYIIFILDVLIEAYETLDTQLSLSSIIKEHKWNKKQIIAYLINELYVHEPFNIKDLFTTLNLYQLKISESIIHTTLKTLKQNGLLKTEGETNKLKYHVKQIIWDLQSILPILARK